VLVGVIKTDLFHEIWALMNGTSDGRERGAEVEFKLEAMPGERELLSASRRPWSAERFCTSLIHYQSNFNNMINR
jgi:hypothetical protein